MNVKEVGCEGVNRMKVARCRIRSPDVVNTVAKAGRYLTAIRHPGMRVQHGSI
jgi:hypothetical protein